VTGPRQPGRGRAGDRLTAHQARILSRRRTYCRALANANRALTFEDCEDVFAETLERDSLGLPAELSSVEAHRWFSRRLQQRAIDFLRHRDGRRDHEKARRLRLVSLDTPAGEDGTSTLAEVLPDADADVSADVEAREDRKQAIIAARRAMERLKPLEQRLLKLRYELPEASTQDLGDMLGLTADQASYRLRVAATKFKKALTSGRLGPECDVARGALRLGSDVADNVALARARAHVEGCWMCRAWQLERAAIAWLPFPAFTKLEWLLARFEARLRPLAPVPETAAGATAAGGASLTIGAGKLAGLCGASAVTATVCVGALTWPNNPSRQTPVAYPDPSPTPARVVSARPTPTATPAPVERPAHRKQPARGQSREPTGRVEADTREVEAAQPAAAPPGANEFEPAGMGSAAAAPPADAPVAGGGEFLP
jgi:RNA polymerase sigma factor (sigma-70 family)